ncbi:acetyltransferase (plasmid) [Sphingomonadaceae bacterium OTU29THOMA1]|nr:acetyltransferase [Sphingomonadaceae bacterium OTU29THOMA1]
MKNIAVVVIGAGGHACVVADALIASGRDIVAFAETDPDKIGTTLMGRPILAQDCLGDFGSRESHQLANGIGGVRDTKLRRRVQNDLSEAGWRFVTVCHPAATVSSHAVIAEGVQLLAGSIVQVGARIGQGAIINTGAIVEHDCAIGEWTHIAPAATLCGDATIGAGSIVGARAVVIQGMRIGDNTLIGAGAVVVRDFGGGGILYGVPARPIGTKV